MPSLPRALLLSAVLCAAACRTSNLGACLSSVDCPAGSTCDTTQESPVCVASSSGCLPACPDGRSCQAAVCVQTACSPACGAGQVCDLTNFTCGPVGAPLTLTLHTDGRTGPVLIGGNVATVRATVLGGSGSGVVPSSVQLAVAGHAALTGTPGNGGLFTFTVPIDDALVV